jgi:bis(5'-nucleosyl)-tetraphosphatase (symmetrical)
LVVREGELLLVHAGLLPSWTPATAVTLSREVEAMLASGQHDDFLHSLYGDQPARWSDELVGPPRWRFIINALTRIRFVAADGTMSLAEKRDWLTLPGFLPWFAHPQRKSAGVTIYCGHWSSLDLMLAPNVLMLDSGCVWGGTLTAIRLDDRRVFQVPSRAVAQRVPSE